MAWPPGADVVADAALDGLVERRLLRGLQAVGAEQAVDRVGVLAAEELAFRVGPGVVLGAGDVDRARRDQRDQQVLVDRQGVLVAGVRVEVPAEPVREAGGDRLHGLADPAAGQRDSPAAGVVAHRHREPRVLGGGPHRGLAEA
ncbi:hypothetical protein GCM10027569_91120 [Flindersiella endophytica]